MIYLLAGFQLLVIITIQLAFLNLVIKNLRIFYQEYLSKFFLRHINPEIGNLNLWDGHNLHKGNLNISENISCAYQI